MQSQKSTHHLQKLLNNNLIKKVYFFCILLLSIFIIWSLFELKNIKQQEIITQPNIVSSIRPPSEGDIIVGNTSARFKVVLYTDYECPFCREVDGKIQEWLTEFGRENIVFHIRHLPLKYIHPKAFEFAKDVECTKMIYGNDLAFSLGLYLYDNKEQPLDLLQEMYTRQIPLIDIEKIKSCRNLETVTKVIEQSTYEALLDGIDRTPSLVIYDSNKNNFILKIVGGGIGSYRAILKEVVKQTSNK